jgi:putative transposase
MSDYKKLTHTIYECKYHVVFCPKYRFRIFRGDIAEYGRSKLYQLVGQKEGVEILELNIQVDHIHMVISIAPKYSVSGIIGFLKGKLTTGLFYRYEKLGKKYWGRHLWSRGYCVSTVGLDEEKIRKYVQYQERKDREIEQHQLSL